MEAAASVAVAARGVSMTMPSSQSQSSRKEWRVISDHHGQKSGDEGTEQGNSDFFSITVDGGTEHELHLDDVVKQREQLQHLEVNLKARLIARSEVMGMQEHFDSQIKEHITSNVKLQEQLHEREAAIMDLQRTLDDKDKELHAVRLDHEVAWAKEDLLREQNKELATFRRERDNSEAERAQHLQKIHDLQEHVQEKEQQFIELQEQHRVAQETIIFKDEQIREAQAWIARVQEMDALQSTTNHSLQAELRDRTEQYNQLWLGCQRQFSEIERLHQLKIQQLETELSDARERNGTKSDGSRMSQTNVKDISHLVHGNGSQLEVSSESKGLQNGDTEVVSSQTDNILAVQMSPQSLHGMPNYFPPGQITAMHPFILHHQNANSHLIQSHVGQFHSLPANASIPHWQNQQAFSESLQMQNNDQYPSQNDQNLSRPETNYNYEASVNGQVNEAEQQSLQQISSQFHGFLRLNHSGNEITHQEKNANSASEVIHLVMVSDATPNKVDNAAQNNYLVGKTAEKTLFDEETLLACVVRTIPPGPGGRIQISSTLLSRLTKMLAPLLWSDYENKHGKLDVFLGSHPELFEINGDYIQVREGAQEIIAGMVARAKHRATTISASATSSHPSLLSSVAVTPMAQTRLKKPQSVNSNYANAERNRFNESQQSVNSNYTNAERNRFNESQQSNGVSFNPVGVRVLRKQNDELKLANGNGTNLDRPNYHGKQQGRSTGALPGSRN